MRDEGELAILRLVILDLDGVIYRGNQPLPGAVESVAWLRERGHQVYFLTNNSTLSRSQYARRLKGMGIPAREEEIMTSAYATARYLAREKERRNGARVLVVGEQGLEEELRAAELEVVRELGDGGVDFVVVGMDRGFGYQQLHDAQQAILRGAEFIATNRDATYPVENGGVMPGGGSIVAAIAAASGKEPLLIGKPERPTVEAILEASGAAANEALIVGDRLDTDIALGRRVGLWTALVLTGVSSREEAELTAPALRPHWVLQGVKELPGLIQREFTGDPARRPRAEARGERSDGGR
jgi:phosphoglycolate/pyridoxal phosphate phosphatase family enzyme